MTDEEDAYEITVLHPLKKFRFGKLERHDDGSCSIDGEHFPAETLVSVTSVNDDPPGPAIPMDELFDSEKIMERLKEYDRTLDPEWMVPVLFRAATEEDAFHAKDLIDMILKRSAREWADLNDRRVVAFGLMRWDMYGGANEFVERKKKQ